MATKLVRLLESEGYKPKDIPTEIKRRKDLERERRNFNRFQEKHGGKGIFEFIKDFEKRITKLEEKVKTGK